MGGDWCGGWGEAEAGVPCIIQGALGSRGTQPATASAGGLSKCSAKKATVMPNSTEGLRVRQGGGGVSPNSTEADSDADREEDDGEASRLYPAALRPHPIKCLAQSVPCSE